MTVFSDELSKPVGHLDDMVEHSLGATGIQLFVARGGEVVCDLALGDGVSGLMSIDTVHNNYCLAKPIVAVALGRLASEDRLDLNVALSELGIPAWAIPPSDPTVLDVLDHQVGLDTLAGMEYRIAPLEVAPELFAERIATSTRRPAYSEILGGVVLEEVLRRVTGTSADTAVTQLALEPAGIGGVALGAGPAAELASSGRVSVPIGGLPDRRVPLLFEMLQQSFDYLRPAFGVLCSARSIGMFMESLRSELADEPTSPFARTLVEMLTPRHESFDDGNAGRSVTAAGGFMVDVAANGFCTLASRRSFGHNAGMAQSIAFTDPDAELTISLYLNGAEVGPSSVLRQRVQVVDGIYRALGLA